MKAITFLLAIALVSVNAVANNKKFNNAAALSEKKVAAPAFSEKKVMTHYDVQGNLLATSRFISDADLPLYAITKLMKHCPDEQIKLVREFDASGEKTYIVTLENATGFKVVKVTNADLEILEKLTKS
jgi:hypothetical protein